MRIDEPEALRHVIVSSILLSSRVEGPGFEFETNCFLLHVPLWGTLHLPLFMLLLRCSHLHDAHLSNSVWSTLYAIGEERKEQPSQTEVIRDHAGP